MVWKRVWLVVLATCLLWATGGRSALAEAPPTFAMAIGEPVTIEAADKILRARMKSAPRAAAAPKAKIRPLSTSTVSCAGASSQPVEIITLAAALKCNVDLIYEYVYNNIEYEPLFGSNKGALGTLLDQRGNDIDQAQLMAALLSAAGYSSSQVSFYYGYIRVTGAAAPGWLGVKNDGNAIGQLLEDGGIPINASQWFRNTDGTLNRIDVAHVWLQVQIGSTNYVFDPSFKQHNVKLGLSNLATAMGYTQSGFLADAGGTIDSVSISAINRPQLRADLTAYSTNLVKYIKAQNPAWTVNDIVGGKTIVALTGSPVRQTSLPYISPVQPTGIVDWGAAVPNAYRTCLAVSMPTYGTNTCGSATANTMVFYADQTYGHRITIFSTPSGANFIPTLLLDGAPPPNGQNAGPATAGGTTWPIYVSITHPYASGPLATAANQATTMSIAAGGSYLLGAGWGDVGRGMIEKHRNLLAQYRAAGQADSSEAVLGETLAVISYSWLAENASADRLSDGIGAGTTQYHHGVGITAQTTIQGASGTQGPYVDLPLNFDTIQPQTAYTGSCFSPTQLAIFFAGSGLSSSLESAVLEQTQALVAGMQAASTVRLVDNNAATGAKTFFADGTTASGLATYFSTIRPNLTASYAASDLSEIDTAVSTTGLSTGAPTGKQVLIPASGSNAVGHWTGAGYTISAISCPGTGVNTISVTQRISGGLSGGFSGTDVPTSAPINLPALAPNTENLTTPSSAVATVPSSALSVASAPGNYPIAEPVDGIVGAYLYQHSDLITGSGSFPYALTFGRNYSSASYLSDEGLGNGWSNSFSIAASRTSDPYVSLGDRATSATAPSSNSSLAASGESSAIAAAQAIAATYVAQDLMSSGTLGAQKTTLAWMTERWLTDQLTNNAVMVTWPTSSEEYTWLPHADGSTSFAYNPPPGSAVALTGSVPDAYGNPTTFTYVNKDRSQLAFTAIGSAGNGQVASWTLPSGMGVNFAYGYSYNNLNYLTSVTNTLGRSLTLAYATGHVSTVTDDAGRSIGFSYGPANDLTSASDPLGAATTFAYDRSGAYDSTGHLTQVFYPANPGSAFVTNWYDGLGRVSQQANANGANTQFYFAGARTETVDPVGNRHVTYQTGQGKVLMDAAVLSGTFGVVFNDTAQSNGVINVSAAQYDGQDRLVLATAPEKGTTAYSYSPDLLQNVVKTVQTQKPGSPLTPLTTTYAYDPVYNKRTQITDPLGLVSSFSYDPATGNLLLAVADVGAGHFNAVSRFTYDGLGHVLTATDPLGSVTASTYDAKGNLASTVRNSGGLNVTNRFAYDAVGNPVSATDPNGNVTTAGFDADRRPLSTTAPGTGGGILVTSSTYDANGQRLSVSQAAGGTVLASASTAYTLTGKAATTTDANGNVTRYAYDAADRLSAVTDPVGNVTSYGYDALSRKISTSNLGIQSNPLVSQTYTPDGLAGTILIARNNTSPDTTSYAYDGFDRLSTTTYPNGGSGVTTEGLTYDADSNVKTRTTRKGDVIALTYDTLNRLSTKAAPSEPTVTYAYDLAGRLIAANDNGAVTAAPSGSGASFTQTATYDALNRPLGFSWTPAATQTTPASSSSVAFTHTYDADNRRIGQAANDNSWLSYPGAASTTAYTANALNQYTAVGSAAPTYDANGALIFDGTLTYTYDAESRLTSVKQGATTVATYAYDAQGRRKTKTVGSVTTAYVTDADNREVLEYSGSTGALQTWYAYGAGSNEVLNQINIAAGTRTTLIPDIIGSTIGSLSSAGTLSKIGYQPFGESSSTTTASNGFFFTGGRLDAETVGSTSQPSGIYYLRNRMYLPGWGRFPQADPSGYGAGPNLYTYALNSPLNLVDPFGLTPDAPGQGGGNIVLASNAQTYGAAGAVAGAVVVSGGCDIASAGVCAVATPATVGLGAVIGGGLGYVIGSVADTIVQNDQSGEKPASTPTGQRGSPIDVTPGTNSPENIGGRDYTGHGLDQMQGRGVPPSAVEDAINNGNSSPGNQPGTTVHNGSNGVTVVTGSNGQVITVIPRGR